MEITGKQIVQAYYIWFEELECLVEEITGLDTDMFPTYEFTGDFCLGYSPAESLKQALDCQHSSWIHKLSHKPNIASGLAE